MRFTIIALLLFLLATSVWAGRFRDNFDDNDLEFDRERHEVSGCWLGSTISVNVLTGNKVREQADGEQASIKVMYGEVIMDASLVKNNHSIAKITILSLNCGYPFWDDYTGGVHFHVNLYAKDS